MVSSVRSGRRITVAQALGLLLAFLLMSALGGVLAAGLVMPAVGATSTVTNTSVRLFDDLPEELETPPLSEKSVILAADGTLLAEFFVENRIVVPLDQVSQPMRDAVIAIEDHRFYEHGAIDPRGMMRALVQNVTTDSNQGGSTLTQQYVKNVLLQNALQASTPEERQAAIEAATASEGTEGYARKLAEAKMAIALEQRWSKDQILEAYMNIAQFGHSVYGVEAAAQYYFSVPASQLNYLQAATIAGITREPSNYDPTRNPEESQRRRNVVLSRMYELGMITKAEFDSGKATPIEETLQIGQPKYTCMAANAVGGAGYFCDYVTKVIANDPIFGETRAERGKLLNVGGLTITTTLDVPLQIAANEEVQNGVPVMDPSGVGSAIVVVNPGSGKILAMAQNRVYNNTTTVGPGETSVNYNTDFAYGGSTGFAPGSTFKPFTLLQWFKAGHGLNEYVNGSPRTWRQNEFTVCGAPAVGGDWRLRNSEGGSGVMTVLDATRRSVNNGFADMASQLDLCDIMNGAAELGVHLPGGGSGEGPYRAFPANIIGSDSIAPLTMANAFATFASGGVYCDPIAITSIRNRAGEELPIPSANCRQAIDPGIAAAMNYTLSHVWTGTGRPIGALPDRVAAGKTGTTSENEHTWFVGYTPQLSAAVWVGFPDANRPMQRININGSTYRNVYGSSVAGPTWRRFMVRANTFFPAAGFADPPRQYLTGIQVRVPAVNGMTIEDAVRTLEAAGFRAVVGGPVHNNAAAGLTAGTEPNAGAQVTRGSSITVFPSAGPQPAQNPPGGEGPGGGQGGGPWPGGSGEQGPPNGGDGRQGQ